MFKNAKRAEAFGPGLAEAIRKEALRQETHIELIASEDYASPRVCRRKGQY